MGSWASVGRRRNPIRVSILQRIASGEQAAVAECMDRYGGLVWSLARRSLGSASDAEDLVQEIFVDVWKSAPRFDPATAAEATFIAMIARRRLIDRHRKVSGPAAKRVEAQAEAAAAQAGAASTPAAKMYDGEDLALATEAIAELPAEHQRVLRLGLVQGLTHEEIARATGLPLGTVKTNMRRGLARVRERLRQGSEVMR